MYVFGEEAESGISRMRQPAEGTPTPEQIRAEMAAEEERHWEKVFVEMAAFLVGARQAEVSAEPLATISQAELPAGTGQAETAHE